MKPNANRQLAEQAFERFANARQHIEEVKDGIERTRKGEATIADIQSDKEHLKKRLARESMPLEQALERINGVANFQDVLVLRKIFHLADSVGRITIKNQYGTSGFGTGFLIAPGIIITNHHVFPDEITAKHSYIQFNYELNVKGEPLPVATFSLEPERLFITSSFDKKPSDPHSGLDFTIVAVSEKSKEGKSIYDIPYAVLDATLGKIIEGESCVVIQHPKGDFKKIVLKDIRMLTLTEEFLIYESDTLPGSSGAIVVGLGTGEVVALHHSGVPKKNAQGQWLRKDGNVVRAGDSDEDIDWIGNEGIRVSCILNAIRAQSLPDHMQVMYQRLLGSAAVKSNDPVINYPSESQSQVQAQAIDFSNQAPLSPSLSSVPLLTSSSNNSHLNYMNAAYQYFEIELSEIDSMQEDWLNHYKAIVPEIVSCEALFPFSTIPEQRRLYYLSISSDKNPWELAAMLEALPQVDSATPDLPMDTDVQGELVKQYRSSKEFQRYESTNNGTAEWNESEFITDWKLAHYCKDDIANKKYERMRAWNRYAVNMPDTLEELEDWDVIHTSIKNINLVQLDTGYTDHSKVINGYNLNQDEDFIDGEDARDEMNGGVLRHPGHGTRTASIIIGNRRSDFNNDGNFGLLQGSEDGAVKLIPYRIAQSVVLIGRGKHLVDAANHAIGANADVMFMCMGSYPRPMIYEVAKSAYDRGVIWVCAAGNEVESVVAPALYPGTIAVAAFNPDQRPWKGSSYGPVVDIAAPGEDVYVPFINKKFEEIMVYGSGTSYATPHVAAAAMLWKAKHLHALSQYKQPWQIVEAFRYCLRKSASEQVPDHWDTANYGAGLLDVQALLKMPLPPANKLKYAYENKMQKPSWDLGMREGVHYLWQTLVKKVTPGPESTSPEMLLTERARITLAALSKGPTANVFEGYTISGQEKAENILNMYFKSFQK